MCVSCMAAGASGEAWQRGRLARGGKAGAGGTNDAEVGPWGNLKNVMLGEEGAQHGTASHHPLHFMHVHHSRSQPLGVVRGRGMQGGGVALQLPIVQQFCWVAGSLM
jgi:hypothetical protein